MPLIPDFSLEIDAMVIDTTLRTKVITLVSPSHPTYLGAVQAWQVVIEHRGIEWTPPQSINR